MVINHLLTGMILQEAIHWPVKQKLPYVYLWWTTALGDLKYHPLIPSLEGISPSRFETQASWFEFLMSEARKFRGKYGGGFHGDWGDAIPGWWFEPFFHSSKIGEMIQID